MFVVEPDKHDFKRHLQVRIFVAVSSMFDAVQFLNVLNVLSLTVKLNTSVCPFYLFQ